MLTSAGGQSSFTAIGPGRPISENPLQDAGLSSARGMIKNCLSSHTICRPQKPTTLPKRVLDVGQDSNTIALHESAWNEVEKKHERGEYTALSYIRSSEATPQTTKQNLQSHVQNVPWSTLPKLFQDAVLLTRALGIRYIFIDALCLLQDDDQALLEESLQTHHVFTNAFLTIAATSAPSPTHPLFPPKPASFEIQATDTNNNPLATIYIREQPSHYTFKAPFDEASHMNDWELPFGNMSERANVDTPLSKDAWAYTQRLLSPRVLHFTAEEMILECRESWTCECGRISDAAFDARCTDSIKQDFARVVCDALGPANGVNVSSQALASTSTSATPAQRNTALHLWTYIVTEFTTRHTPSPTHILPAIAPLARALSAAVGSGYIAGHFTCSTLSLLWYPNPNPNTTSATTRTDLPTWSWSSCAGAPIHFDMHSAMDLACTLSFGPRGKRRGAWSPVQGEACVLSARLVADVVYRNAKVVRNGVGVAFRPDVCGERMCEGEGLVVVCVCMTYRSEILGIVLRVVRDEGVGDTYRRVGRFECVECRHEDDGEDGMSEDAEALFGYWFPEIGDMMGLEGRAVEGFTVM